MTHNINLFFQIKINEKLSTGICVKCSDFILSIEKFIESYVKIQNHLEKLLDEDDEEIVDETAEIPHEGIPQKPKKVKRKLKRTSDEFPDKKCPICWKQFTETRKIPLHIKRMHTKVKDFHCEECEYSAFTKFDITRHIKNVHSPKVESEDKRICPDCGKVVRGNNQLTLHIKKKHLMMKKFQCDICSFTSYGKYEMRSHLEHIHVPKEFKESFPCPLCPSVLSSSMGLKVHHQHKHSGLKPHQCTKCEKSFSLKETLKTHIRNVHYRERKFGKIFHKFAHFETQNFHLISSMSNMSKEIWPGSSIKRSHQQLSWTKTRNFMSRMRKSVPLESKSQNSFNLSSRAEIHV